MDKLALSKILLGDIIARMRFVTAGLYDCCLKAGGKCYATDHANPVLHIVKSSGSNVSRNTLADYLAYMDDAYLTFSIPNFTDTVAERASSRKRYYYDNGLLNNFLFDGEAKLLENMVAIHLIKCYQKVEEDGVFFYNKGVEVDFYVPDKAMAIQVSYSIDDPMTRGTRGTSVT